MPRKRRLWVALGLALAAYVAVVVMVFTRPGAALSTDKRPVIRIAHWQVEVGPREAMEALAAAYNARNPDVRVEVLAVPGNVYVQWLRTQLTGGTAPDIIEFGFWLHGSRDIPARYFAPITDYVEQPNPYNRGTPQEHVRWRDTFLDGLNTNEGYIRDLNNYYAVTLCMLSMRLFYNADLLEEITGSREPPRTYAELQALGAALQGRTSPRGAALALFAGSNFNTNVTMEVLLARTALSLNHARDRFREHGAVTRDFALDYLRGGWDYRQPELESGFALLREIALLTRPGFQQLERDAAMQEFMRGEAVAIYTGTWDATSLQKLSPFDLAVAEFPLPDRSHPAVGAHIWLPQSEGQVGTAAPFFLNNASPHREAAIDFMRFMTSVPGNQIFVEASGWLPSVEGVEVPDHLRPHLPRRDGWMGRSAILRAFGAETSTLWQRLAHRLVSREGGVEPFLTTFAPAFADALRTDLTRDARNALDSIRRQVPALAGLATLDRLEGVDPARLANRLEREASQHLTEARYYETLAVLDKGPAVTQ
ncbi:MAG: extracellular solute-binding protein [Opitutaceae bacterium]|nr:extracellular solute-binding protein [Opitutaceae bacterium]